MTQSPSAYSPFPGEEYREQKTSIMAIVALVCSLLGLISSCLIVGGIPALLGVTLGVFSLLMISNSNGRLGGRGLAIAALIIGLISTAISVSVFIGATQVSKSMKGEFSQPLGQLMLDIDAKDFAKARKSLTPAAASAITDEDFTRFLDGYQAELGHAKAPPESMFELFSLYSTLGPQMQQFQGGQNVIPFPGSFDNGTSVIAFQVDKNGGPGQAIKIPVSNIMVITPSGKKVTLYDPAASANSPLTMPMPPGAEQPAPQPAEEPGAVPPGGQ